jgi:hypothetical protein
MENLQLWLEAMRDEHRLKLNTDFAYTLKYRELMSL